MNIVLLSDIRVPSCGNFLTKSQPVKHLNSSSQRLTTSAMIKFSSNNLASSSVNNPSSSSLVAEWFGVEPKIEWFVGVLGTVGVVGGDHNDAVLVSRECSSRILAKKLNKYMKVYLKLKIAENA